MSLSKILRTHADSLAPSEELKQLVREVNAELQDILHEWACRENYKISRVVPHGSYAKKTSVWYAMDLDIIVVLNKGISQLEDCKDTLHNVIIDRIDENCENRSHALKFQMRGLKVDLMLAANYVLGPCENVAETQVKNLLHELKQRKDMTLSEKKEYSTASLSEGAIEFEKRSSAFSHALSRLAKRWSMSIGIPGFKRGRSSIMEYLGAWAATEEERPPRKADLLAGFRRFLKLVECPDDLRIFWPLFYREKDIPQQIRSYPPILLDPTSPYDNLLEGVRGTYLKQMSPYAKETLRRLDEAERRGEINLGKLFEPNPRIEIIYRSNTVKSPRRYLISTRESSLLVPKVETRAGAKGVNHHIMESYLFSLTDAVAAAVRLEEPMGSVYPGNEETIARRVKSELQQFISPGQWHDSSEEHRNKASTFTISVGKGSNQVILISCDWE